MTAAEQREGVCWALPAAPGRSPGPTAAATGQVPLAADTKHTQGGDSGAK